MPYKYEGIIVHTNVNPPSERSLSEDGYNYGKPWQCVEFVKRFYYKKLNHKMPNTWGHAINFYNPHIKSGSLNVERNLIQYKNNGVEKPKKYDLIVMETRGTKYGHVAIVHSFKDNTVTIIQQNTRHKRGKIKLNKLVKGWLRIKK